MWFLALPLAVTLAVVTTATGVLAVVLAVREASPAAGALPPEGRP
jgi:hypothetical protein